MAMLVTIKLLLVLATVSGYFLHQLGLNNAFLHGELDEKVYMTIINGYGPKREHRSFKRSIYKLHKSLYGLKQASR